MKKIITLIFCLLFPAIVKSEEKIINFDVLMHLNNNGGAVVTENITVAAEHFQIKRGIYRDLPQKRGNFVTVVSLDMDGMRHPYFTENINNNLRINFGDDNFIQTGVHTYSFTYEIKNIVGFFKNYDEVFWNVTGNGWIFPIDKAKFVLELPSGANVINDKISLYTGKYGSKESDARQTGKLSFETSRILSAGEGFSVAVPFQKGIVKEPDLIEKYLNFQNAAVLSLVIFFLIYYLVIWNKIGRDPKSKIIRQYSPPKDTSPAFAKYISEMNCDSCLVIIFVSLAVKGIIKINQEEGSFLQKNSYTMVYEKEPETGQLSEEEELVYRKLFSGGRTVKISGYNEDIEEINKELKGNLKLQEQGLFFRKNALWHIPLIISIFSVMFYLFSIKDVKTIVMVFFASVFFIPARFLISSRSMTKKAALIKFILIVFIFFIAFKANMYMSSDILIFCAVVLLCVTGMVFNRLLPAYTQKGRLLMDEIEGFKEYLSIAEENRTFFSDPTNAQQIYCDYLPYAIALGVENKWTKYFESSLGRSMIEQSMHSRGVFLNKGLMSGYIGGFSSALTGAGVKPGRAGGGGFSGGGFGGGGGGGR